MRSTKILERQFYGEEPVLKGAVTESQLTRALNWYNYMGDEEKGLGWLLDYLKKANYSSDVISGIRSAPKNRIRPTDFWLARLLLNGAILSQEVMDRLDERIRKSSGHVIKEDSPIPTISIQERSRRATWNLITDIEEMLDRDPQFSLETFLKDSNASGPAIEAVRKYYAPHLEEVTSNDPQVAEAYGPGLSKWKKIFSRMIQDCDKLLENKKSLPKVRKPRKLKVKSPADLVKRMKYKDKEPALNLSSIDPQKIIGAMQLWVYNTKYRTIGVYNTNSAKGFSVKGTTILNFDAEKSVARKLRKPEEQLKLFSQQGKVGLRTYLTNIKAKDIKLNGRINNDIILLRVV